MRQDWKDRNADWYEIFILLPLFVVALIVVLPFVVLTARLAGEDS